MSDIAQVQQTFARLREEVRKIIVGQDQVVEMILTALLMRGHVLLEGVPGTAKTLTVKTITQIIGCAFQRLQMTPDLMPSDILGTNIYDAKTSNFRVQKGPIFADLVLVDEINRAPAKTQSALLECMEERQVTIEGNRFALSPIFMVLATQNPLEYEGTYPLPEAQLDRFAFKVLVPYPTADEEGKMLQQFEAGFRTDRLKEAGLTTIGSVEMVQQCQEMIKKVVTKPPIIDYIATIVRATRNHNDLLVGGGPRSSISLLLASKARALMTGRDYVNPDDVKEMVFPVLRHRVILKPEAEIEGLTADECLKGIVGQVKVPR